MIITNFLHYLVETMHNIYVSKHLCLEVRPFCNISAYAPNHIPQGCLTVLCCRIWVELFPHVSLIMEFKLDCFIAHVIIIRNFSFCDKGLWETDCEPAWASCFSYPGLHLLCSNRTAIWLISWLFIWLTLLRIWNAVKCFRKKTGFQIKLRAVSLEGKISTPLAMFSKQTRNCCGNSCNKLGSQLSYIVIENHCTLKVLPNISEKWHPKYL